MREPAERNRRALFLLLEFFRLAVDHVRERAARSEADAEGPGGEDKRRDAGRAAHADAVPARQRADRCKQGNFRMASPITPPRPVGSGQPPLFGRQDAKAAVMQDRAEPEQHTQPFTLEPPMRDHAPAPDRKRQNDHDRAEPENLDQEIGCDRARAAEKIADRRVGGVTEARVLHRPGRERERRDDREHEQAKPDQFDDAAANHAAEIVGEKIDLVDIAMIDRRHQKPQSSTATRRCNASAVVSRSCTMAMRIYFAPGFDPSAAVRAA